MKKTMWMAMLIAAAGGMAVPGLAEPKRDVADPVLQEVITSFTQRMPRFVDKHGIGLFVADEPITRSSLMMALYEYDKSFKIPTREYATRQELSDLKARLVSLERSVVTSSGSAGGQHDITQIINDLAPNMPFLLDNSLNNSQVFSRLKNEVASRQGAGSGVRTSPAAAAELADLTRRLDRLERSASTAAAPQQPAAPGADIAALNEEVQRSRLQNRRDIVKLERRLADVEKGAGKEHAASSSGETKQYSSVLTKMSFGLSMLAALFIAR